MLVCNVSLRPPRRAIAAGITEAAAASDAATTGFVVFATLVDDPASVDDTVDAYLGEIMLEAVSAADSISAGMAYVAVVVEAASATDLQDATVTAASASTWNPADKSASQTLSNGNLTTTNTTGLSGGVRSTISKTAGRFYIEYTWLKTAANNSSGCGNNTATGPLNSFSTGSMGVTCTTGNIVNAGTILGSVGAAIVAGDVVCIAIDLTNQKYWARRNGGLWNNSGTADPVTNTGGISISSIFGATAAYAWAAVNENTHAVTANFGATSFAQTMPSGFTAWT